MALITSGVSNIGKSGDAGSSKQMEIAAGTGVTLTQSGQTVTVAMTAPNSAVFTTKSPSSDLAAGANATEVDYVSSFTVTSGLNYFVWGFWNLTSSTTAINLVAKIETISGTLADIDIAFNQYRGATTSTTQITANNTFSGTMTANATTAGIQVIGNFRCTASGSAKFVIRQGTTNAAGQPYLNGRNHLYVYGYDSSSQNIYVDDSWGLDLI